MGNAYTILWAPWRLKYIQSVSKDKTISKCLFCELVKKDDKEAYIIYRGRYNYIVLNAFPYTTGHVMIVPYKHVRSIEQLDDETLVEMVKLLKIIVKVLKETYAPDGFNIGFNIGRAAGAGVEAHVHLHIVPRWVGDSNFMTIISATRVLPEALEDTYNKLKSSIKKYVQGNMTS